MGHLSKKAIKKLKLDLHLASLLLLAEKEALEAAAARKQQLALYRLYNSKVDREDVDCYEWRHSMYIMSILKGPRGFFNSSLGRSFKGSFKLKER